MPSRAESDAALARELRALEESSPPVYTLRSSVWRKRGERWRMVFHQATLTSPGQLPD